MKHHFYQMLIKNHGRYKNDGFPTGNDSDISNLNSDEEYFLPQEQNIIQLSSEDVFSSSEWLCEAPTNKYKPKYLIS